MSSKLIIGAAFAAVLLGILGGYGLGAGAWPFVQAARLSTSNTAQETVAAHKVLY